jgi:very-short-patch-repair endonuclease
LRGKQLGYKFRRQHSIRYYIADFYCAEKKLIIELDGAEHFTKEGKQSDMQRDTIMEGMGYCVLRFTNNEIDADIEKVMCNIMDALEQTSPKEERG